MPNGNAAAKTAAAEAVTGRIQQATVHVFWPLQETPDETIPWATDRCLGCLVSGLGLGPQPQAALTVITYADDRPVLQSTFTLFGRQRVVVVRDCLTNPDFALWQRRHQQAIAEFGAQTERALGAYILRRLQPALWAIALGGWLPVAIDLQQQRANWFEAGTAAVWAAIIYGGQRWGARWLQRQILRAGNRLSTWVLIQTLRHANLL
ncbi:MAG: hypothetical protein SNJ60_05420 [Pseudanabaenaceae cyanobacterium]